MIPENTFTVPNALSFARLLGVPIFFWLIVGPHNDVAAMLLLIASSFTDWLDGYLARRLNQQSRLGELLDPAADRLYVVATLIALVIRDLVPLWVAIVLIGRDVIMAVVLIGLKRNGITGIPVHFVGKAATMNLLYALPLVLLGSFSGTLGRVAHIFGWAFLLWGIAMYWHAAVLYLRQIRHMRIRLFR